MGRPLLAGVYAAARATSPVGYRSISKVSVMLLRYRHCAGAGEVLIAFATTRAQVGVARPEGFEHTPPTIVIKGVDELVQALLAA